MTKVSKRFDKGVVLTPTTTAASIEGEIRVDSAVSKAKAYLNGSERALVSEDQSQTLTNKTLDIDNNTLSNVEVDNLKSGVLNTSTTLAAASNTQVPSALAVKTYVDDKINTVNDASEIAFSNVVSGLAATNVQTALDEIDGNVDGLVSLSGVALDAVNLGTFTGVTIPDNQTNKQALQSLETAHEAHLNDTTDAHAASAITNTPSGNLAATTAQAALNELQGDIDTINTDIANDVEGPASATDNAIARFDTTTGQLVQNSVAILSDVGALSGLTQLDVDNIRVDGNVISSTDTNGNLDLSPNGTGIVNANKDARFFQDVAFQMSTDAATGANATLTAPSTKIIRLTDASLTSIDMIPAGSQGQQITLINATGVAVTINNNTGATAGNRILTGQQAAVVIKDEASLMFEYDSTESRWMLTGGSGGSSSGSDNSYNLTNLGLATSVSANALTIALKTGGGADPSGGSTVNVGFRNATATTGQYSTVNITSALSLVISSGSTLGQRDGISSYIYIYLINNAGTAELAVSRIPFDDGSIVTTVAEGGAGAADLASTMYSATARTGVACRMVGRLKNTQTTAGTWASAGAELSLQPFCIMDVACLAVKLSSQSIATSAATKITFTDVSASNRGYDPYSMVDTTNSKLIAPAAKRYRIFGNISASNYEASAARQMYIYKNGSSHVRFDQPSYAVGTTRDFHFNYILDLAKDDYLEFYNASTDTAYSVEGNTGTDTKSFFGMEMLGINK